MTKYLILKHKEGQQDVAHTFLDTEKEAKDFCKHMNDTQTMYEYSYIKTELPDKKEG